MSDSTTQTSINPIATGDWLGRGLLVLIGLAFLLKLHLVFVLNVNWDEFHHLESVYSHLRGELTSPLQTIQVHFFTWLSHLPGDLVDQVIAARLVMYGFALSSAFLIYRIGRCFLDPAATLFALLCYLAFSYVVEHGTSFRADPIATFFCLSSVYFLLRTRPAWFASLCAGLALAAAAMVTIKSVFYLPAVGFLLLLSSPNTEDRGRILVRIAVFAVSFACGFAALYLLHRASFGPVELRSPTGFAAQAAGKVIRLDTILPRWRFLGASAIENTTIWALFCLGAASLVGRAWKGSPSERVAAVPMLIFLLPLASFLVYRNAFPYFYTFIMPLPMLACGALFAAAVRSPPSALFRSPKPIAIGLTFVVAANLGQFYVAAAKPALQLQRQTIALVHRLFPNPVAYIDRCGMISSYPKVGFFMSTWGMENYLARGEHIFRDLVRRERPLFLIANISSLDPAVPPDQIRALGRYSLFDDDHAVLASNYVHHWGALYVAGKTLDFPTGDGVQDFEILIPGTYTLEAEAPLTINGQTIAPSEALRLEPGKHRASASGQRRAILRWGERLYQPTQPPVEGPIFTGF